MNYQTHIFPNGIRLIHQEAESPAAHFGVIINTGSRDEQESEQGLAHFIEHVIFKGTKKRKAYHILSRLEDVGGELNAYTTKEETALFATILPVDYGRAIELISDILINSVYPAKEIEREKEVIIEEINSYKDTPSELIYDEFEEMLYDGHPLARNILGTPEYVRSFNRDNICSFIDRNYNTDQIVICSVGKISFNKLIRLVSHYFGDIPENKRMFSREKFENYKPSERIVTRDTYQAHCILGNIAYDHSNPKRMALVLLNNILGGQSSNSRLNLSLRERNGMAYNVESSYSSYSDTGLFTIYFGTDKENIERALQITYRELDKLKNEKLGIQQLAKAKKQLIGQMAISQENLEDLLLALGKSFMLYNQVDTLEAIYEKIGKITSADLLDTANEIFDQSRLTTLIYK
ncbi:MAG: pitrilysin family protein [Bacteroidota bacterium]|nr:pitrilysin family protein [Bacteroidota bacterium]